MKDRTKINDTAALEVEEEAEVRPLSLCSLLALKLLKNPLADVLQFGGEIDAGDIWGLCEFGWIHCAPWAEVRGLLARVDYKREAVREAVLTWSSAVSPEKIVDIFSSVCDQRIKAAAASFELAEPRGGVKKTPRRRKK